MRNPVIHASDEQLLDLDWPQHLIAQWRAAQKAQEVYRSLDDQEAAIHFEDTKRGEAPSDEQLPIVRALAVQAFELWQGLEHLFSDSLRVWSEDDPTDGGRDWEHEALALREAQRDAEHDQTAEYYRWATHMGYEPL